MIEGLLQPTHLIIILFMVLIVFGAGKLPEVGGALGKGIREFKQATNEDAALPRADASAQRPSTAADFASREPRGTATLPDEV